MAHKYTEEQSKFIKENINGRRSNELTSMFNKNFNLDLKVSQIRAYIKNHNLKSGIDCRFTKGSTPHNKGVKGVGGWEPTQFKKGNRPANYLPIGSERVNGDDYIDIKIEDPNKWKGKHILIWEQHNGAVPKGHVVIFADRNNRNFDINNLILVSRQQLLIMNKNKLIQDDTDLTKTGVIIANIYQKISEKRKSSK